MTGNPRDHIAAMAAYQLKWDQLILSTEPVDKPKAEDLIRRIYKQFKHDVVPDIVWVTSPWEPIVRTQKIYERVPDTRKYKGYSQKISDGTFHTHQRKIIASTLRRLGMTTWGTMTPSATPEQVAMWEGLPRFHLNRFNRDFSRMLWRTQHAGFYYGNHYEHLAFFDWCRNEVGLIEETHSAALAIQLAQTVAWWRPHETLCFVSERPTKITFNNPTGPAITWGTKNVYIIDRVEVPEYVVMKPHAITINDIHQETNTEVKRIMINRYKSGIGDFLRDVKAILRDHDERYGTLWRVPGPIDTDPWRWPREEVFYLEVVNRTPEPDGSFKHYFLRMPPSINAIHDGRNVTRMLNTAKEAYDWSFWGLPVSSSDMVES